jgi:PKD repeat protein
VVDHLWKFEHDITSTLDEPVFTYVEPGDYNVSLRVTDDFGCDTTFTKLFKVVPPDLKIPSVFTPNGDGHNDKFVITIKGAASEGSKRNREEDDQDEEPLSTYYKSSELVVFNRWGRIVYKSNDYQNDWDGGGLADGTYFYVLKCIGLKDVVQYQGSVMILTKSRQ